MKHYNKNGIDILLKKTPKTPRISVCMFFKVNKKEKYYGVNSLLARLLLQGTKRYNAIQLNNEFENTDENVDDLLLSVLNGLTRCEMWEIWDNNTDIRYI